jgi:hypothetical protein
MLRFLGWLEGIAILTLAGVALIAGLGLMLGPLIVAIFYGETLWATLSFLWILQFARVVMWGLTGFFDVLRAERVRERFNNPVVAFDASRWPPLGEDLSATVPQQHKLSCYLSLDPVLDVVRVGGADSTARSLVVGLPLVAVCSHQQLRALIALAVTRRLAPLTPLHRILEQIGGGAGARLEVAAGESNAHPARLLLLRALHFLTTAPIRHAEAYAKHAAAPPDGSAVEAALVEMRAIQSAWFDYFHTRLAHTVVLGGLPPVAEGFRLQYFKGDAEDQPRPPETFSGLWLYEQQLLQSAFTGIDFHSLTRVSWEEADEKLLPEHWRTETQRLRPVLEGKRLSDVPELMQDWRAISARILGDDAAGLTPDVRRKQVVNELALAVHLVFYREGWIRWNVLGEITVAKGENAVELASVLDEVVRGKVKPGRFREMLEEWGAADYRL